MCVCVHVSLSCACASFSLCVCVCVSLSLSIFGAIALRDTEMREQREKKKHNCDKMSICDRDVVHTTMECFERCFESSSASTPKSKNTVASKIVLKIFHLMPMLYMLFSKVSTPGPVLKKFRKRSCLGCGGKAQIQGKKKCRCLQTFIFVWQSHATHFI